MSYFFGSDKSNAGGAETGESKRERLLLSPFVGKHPIQVNLKYWFCLSKAISSLGLPWWLSPLWGFPGGSVRKESTCNAGDLGWRPGFDPWVGKIPWRRTWQPSPVFLPGESPWTEEPGRLQSMRSQNVRHGSVTKHTCPLGGLLWLPTINTWDRLGVQLLASLDATSSVGSGKEHTCQCRRPQEI